MCQPSPPAQTKLSAELGLEAWATVYHMTGTGRAGGVSFEGKGTAYAKTQRPEAAQGCYGIISTTGGAQGSMEGGWGMGEQKIRLKRKAALSSGLGEANKRFQLRKGMMRFSF